MIIAKTNNERFEKAIIEYKDTMKKLGIKKWVYSGIPFSTIWYLKIPIMPPLFLKAKTVSLITAIGYFIYSIIILFCYYLAALCFANNIQEIPFPLKTIVIPWSVIIVLLTAIQIYYLITKSNKQFSREIDEAKKEFFKTIEEQ
ncbi:MAG: hypothetical protein HQK51_20275 [Oligoflexia bacterium]|nr:hypothetical protein [Oligoflexia bacterium]